MWGGSGWGCFIGFLRCLWGCGLFLCDWGGNLQSGEWRLSERQGKHYKNIMSLPLLCFSQLWNSPNLKTGHQQFRVLSERCTSKGVWVIQTPDVGRFWCNQFPENAGNSYLPSWFFSPPGTSPQGGTPLLNHRPSPQDLPCCPLLQGRVGWGGMQTL